MLTVLGTYPCEFQDGIIFWLKIFPLITFMKYQMCTIDVRKISRPNGHHIATAVLLFATFTYDFLINK